MTDKPSNLDSILPVNRDAIEALRTPRDYFEGSVPSNRYAAFLDILGFSHAIRERYDSTLLLYAKLLNTLRILNCFEMGVTVKIISDSIVLVGDELKPVLTICNGVLMLTLMEGCLVRGGIGYGKHIEVADGPNNYVVSEALVNAVAVEKMIRYPCVGLHESIEIPRHLWEVRWPAITRQLLYRDGLNIVNPLNPFWGTTAIDRVMAMKDQYPDHNEKFNWFIDLAIAVLGNEPLCPMEYVGP